MPTYYREDHRDCCAAFAASYDLSNLPAMLEIERDVLGCDYGGTSWTTRKQAAEIVGALELRDGVHLLDIGAGSGWPGLFLADSSACDVTLLDLPINALAMALKRARADNLEPRVNAVVASGDALPFATGAFSAITHSDVLCCLPEKTAMLAECRRVAADDGRMSFSVIAVAPGLEGERRRAALEAGPPFVDAPGDYEELLVQGGWRILDKTNCSREHRESLVTLVSALEGSDALVAELGADAVREAIDHRRRQIEVIDAGELVREIFLVAAA